MKISNKIGQRFTRLLVIDKAKHTYNGRSIWVCKCDCGKDINVVGSNLMSGSTKSCGCLKKDNARLKGGLGKTKKHGLSKTRPWRIWIKMRNRCLIPSENNYPRYGGRGIKVCDRWLESFVNFWEDMKDGYSDNLTLDRIDNNGNYEPSNCKWSTLEQQALNRRKRL